MLYRRLHLSGKRRAGKEEIKNRCAEIHIREKSVRFGPIEEILPEERPFEIETSPSQKSPNKFIVSDSGGGDILPPLPSSDF